MKSEFKTEKISSAKILVCKKMNNIREFSSAFKFRELNKRGFNLIND